MCQAGEKYETDANTSIDEQIEILRNGLEEFPHNMYILEHLASVLYEKTWLCKVAKQKDDMRRYSEEAIKIYERLINETCSYTNLPVLEKKYGCNYDITRLGAIQGIAYTYCAIGEIEKAIEWTKKLPNIECTAQSVISRMLQDKKSEERVNQLKYNIEVYAIYLKAELGFLAKQYDDSSIPDEIKRFKEAVAKIEEYAKNKA
jgi:tetratricopeptide (TPR) repeat protein